MRSLISAVVHPCDDTGVQTQTSGGYHASLSAITKQCFRCVSAGAAALYFPQKEYIETVYVGQLAGTPVLQVHAMLDSATERPHFFLCWNRRPYYASWFHMDVSTGVLYLNKTLEQADFSSQCECSLSPFKNPETLEDLCLRSPVLFSGSRQIKLHGR